MKGGEEREGQWNSVIRQEEGITMETEERMSVWMGEKGFLGSGGDRWVLLPSFWRVDLEWRRGNAGVER